MQVLAPAKINLTLDILDRRADGYHHISSIMQTVRLFDTLRIELTEGGGEVELTVDAVEGENIPVDHHNLVHRAASQILSIAGSGQGARIHLSKNIPSQAGLGGGSSDAAATLKTMNSLLGEPFALTDLVQLGAKLGADVPFFLYGGTCLVEGIGEKITPLPPLTPQFIVLLKPNIGVSTVEAYRALDESRKQVVKRSAPSWDGKTVRNDFDEILLGAHPEIAQARETLLAAGCAQACLCGSGSCVFGIVDTDKGEDILTAGNAITQRVAERTSGFVAGVLTGSEDRN